VLVLAQCSRSLTSKPGRALMGVRASDYADVEFTFDVSALHKAAYQTGDPWCRCPRVCIRKLRNFS
jgi:hypothetical protein